MILDRHPSFSGLPAHLLAVMKITPKYLGFWRGGREAESLPHPDDYIDRSWDPAERALVVRYLTESPVTLEGRGSSRCRCCQALNGHRERSDGVYTWPEGLAHYVEAHHIRPPQEFVDHVLKRPAV